jgi:hypothetical protein
MKQFHSCVWRPWPKIKTPTKIESTQCIRYQGLPFMLALMLSRGLRSLTKHNHLFKPSSLEVLWHSIQRKHITSHLSVCLLKLHSAPVMHWAHTGCWLSSFFCMQYATEQAILEQASMKIGTFMPPFQYLSAGCDKGKWSFWSLNSPRYFVLLVDVLLYQPCN